MNLILFLIGFPLCSALLCWIVRQARVRNRIVQVSAVVIILATIALFFVKIRGAVVYFELDSVWLERCIRAAELVIAAYLLWQTVKFKKFIAAGLVVVQTVLVVGAEMLYGKDVHPEYNLFFDKLSLLMALVIGIIGSLICLYAVGYMRDFHADYHAEQKDNRGLFFGVIFLFLSAMFGIVFSNNLSWLYLFWEITTLCSFLLIQYKKTQESYNNAFRALTYNLIGGVAFAAAIAYLYGQLKIIELDKVMFMGSAVVMLPVVLISIAGLTKSAQLPFSSWLLGAMVAPTPVSALLHSSTMVKAGVYIIIRFAAVLQGTTAGLLIALIGAVTFLAASLIAISHSDAKKILAYSTIANLGLIVLCAGVGTYEAVWAAGMLIIFHALAKCLLFLCVGTVEHKIHSRDIEHMSGLIVTMPKLSIMLQIGMAGMFLAPFGMLISKWAVLKALVDYNPLLAVFVVFGSAATLFFWVKWMGRLIIVTEEGRRNMEGAVSMSEWIPLGILSFLTICVCGLFPLVSSYLIQPYLIEIYGVTFTMSHGNIVIIMIMLAMVMLFPLSFINYGKKVKVVDAYLSGANTESHTQFLGAAQVVRDMQMRNYYLERYFGEQRLYGYAAAACLILMVVMLTLAVL
jgi:ech hydrogenase subunit A